MAKFFVYLLAGICIFPITSGHATQPLPPPTQASSGGISGSIGYPSDAIPAMLVVAYRRDDPKKFYKMETGKNQASFTLPNLPPGEYLVVGYALDSSLAGGYTKAVPCGLNADCADHSLIPVKVEVGKVNSTVELKDFYAPANTFPPKP